MAEVKNSTRTLHKYERKAASKGDRAAAKRLLGRIGGIREDIAVSSIKRKDITKACKFSSQGKAVYVEVIKALEKHFPVCETSEELITEIEKHLLKKYARR